MQKSKLTLYIFIALVLGVIAGYLYNVYVINDINNQINTASISIKKIDDSLSIKNNSLAGYKQLTTERNILVNTLNKNNSLREDKLEGFTVLSDIFLRLIKMI